MGHHCARLRPNLDKIRHETSWTGTWHLQVFSWWCSWRACFPQSYALQRSRWVRELIERIVLEVWVRLVSLTTKFSFIPHKAHTKSFLKRSQLQTMTPQARASRSITSSWIQCFLARCRQQNGDPLLRTYAGMKLMSACWKDLLRTRPTVPLFPPEPCSATQETASRTLERC